MVNRLLLLIAVTISAVGCEKSERVAIDAAAPEAAQNSVSTETTSDGELEHSADDLIDTNEWARHVSDAGNWTASFPAQPQTRPAQILFKADRLTAKESAWISPDKTEVFAVRWYERPSPTVPQSRELVRLVESFVAEMGLPDATTKQSKIGVLPVVDVLGKTKTGKILAGRVLVSGTAYLQIFAVTNRPKVAEHFVTSLEYRVPQAGAVTYDLAGCGRSVALPSQPVQKTLTFELSGKPTEALHYVSNAAGKGLALGMICFEVTPDIELDASPRELVEGPLDALTAATGGKIVERDVEKREHQVLATRSLSLEAGQGRLDARAEVVGSRVVVRYVSGVTPDALQSPLVEMFLPTND